MIEEAFAYRGRSQYVELGFGVHGGVMGDLGFRLQTLLQGAANHTLFVASGAACSIRLRSKTSSGEISPLI
jgi:hypothetical protein